MLPRNQNVAGKKIGLFFHRIVGQSFALIENQLLAVLQHVTCLMKEAKPNLIVSFVFQAEQNQRLVL